MALTPDQILRLDEVGGKSISTFKDGANKHIQGVTLVDVNGSQAGTDLNPIPITVKSAAGGQLMEVAQSVEVMEMTFDKWWNNKLVCAEMQNAGVIAAAAMQPKTSSGLNVQCAGVNSMAAVRTRYEIPAMHGIGQTFGFNIRLNSVVTPVAGQVQRWGIGDTTDGIFVEWNGSAAGLFLRGWRAGVLVVNVQSTVWTVPVVATGGGLLKESQIQEWVFKWNWSRNQILIYLDGTLVMNYKPPRADPIMNVTGGRQFVQVLCTIATASNYVMLYSMWYLQNGGQWRFGAWSRKKVATYGIPVGAGIDTWGLHLNFRGIVAGILNSRVARIRKITCAYYPNDIVDSTKSLTPAKIRVWKNLLQTSAVQAVPIEAPYDFANAWNTAPVIPVPFTVVVSGTPANNAGYASGTTARYQITMLGARGESLPYTGPAAVAVGTPAKAIVITLTAPPIDKVVAFKIYRQLGGAGTYQLIGWADPVRFAQVGFVDDGWVAQGTTVPPGASTQEGDTFMAAGLLPSIQGGNAAQSGGVVETIQTSGTNGTKINIYEDGALMLYPGETLTFWLQAAVVGGATAEIGVEWDEEG